ncbi:MAG: methylmalonyl-CoA mutase family protein [Bacteroidetes bacterium]|nr:methylmalonyl-CoA mutase family protein [Bacteroidota bacterium]
MDQNEQKKLFSEFPPVSTKAWEERIIADLKGADYNKKLIWKTDEGFDVKPYYRAEDMEGLEYLNVVPDGSANEGCERNRNNDWLIRQDICEEAIEAANAIARDAVSKGAASIGIKATQVSSHKQMGQLLEGIDLSKTEINFIASQSYPLTLELFIYEVIHRAENSGKIKGSLNFDPISYLLLHGEFYSNWNQNIDDAEYLLRTIQTKLPGFQAITINGHYFQNAGATLVQELAFSLASANEYLTGLTDKGLTVDQVSPFIRFSFGIGPNYFMEIAKLRAARILWARMVEQYKPVSDESLRIFIHAATAQWNMSVYDPYVNMLRTTTEGMSAALGNADSVTVLPFNVSYQRPDDFSTRISRNQQLVLKEESYFDKIIDPAAGSYYIENLTNLIARHAWDLFREVASKGGIIECIKSGFIQDEVEKSRKKKESDIAQRRIIMLGTNQYPNLQETMLDQIQFFQEPQKEKESLYKKLLPYRAAQPYEEVRLATERYVEKGNKRPLVFLFTTGNIAMMRARAGFATNFFGCAGFEIIDNPGFSTVEEGVEAALASTAEIVVICSSDEEYPLIVPEIASRIRLANNQIQLVVAGYPKDYIEQFKLAGIDDFIHIRSDLPATLKSFQQCLASNS